MQSKTSATSSGWWNWDFFSFGTKRNVEAKSTTQDVATSSLPAGRETAAPAPESLPLFTQPTLSFSSPLEEACARLTKPLDCLGIEGRLPTRQELQDACQNYKDLLRSMRVFARVPGETSREAKARILNYTDDLFRNVLRALENSERGESVDAFTISLLMGWWRGTNRESLRINNKLVEILPDMYDYIMTNIKINKLHCESFFLEAKVPRLTFEKLVSKGDFQGIKRNLQLGYNMIATIGIEEHEGEDKGNKQALTLILNHLSEAFEQKKARLSSPSHVGFFFPLTPRESGDLRSIEGYAAKINAVLERLAIMKNILGNLEGNRKVFVPLATIFANVFILSFVLHYETLELL